MVKFRLCSQFNLTWAVIMTAEKHFFYSDKEGYPASLIYLYYFEGLFFESMSDVKKNKRCRFKWFDQLGKKLQNGSYDGSINALIQSEVDIHLRPMDYHIDVGLIDHSTVVKSSNIETCHAIEPKAHLSTSTSLQELFGLLIPSTPLLVAFLVVSLFYLLAVFLSALAIKKCFRSSNAPNRTASEKANFRIFDSFLTRRFRSILILLTRSAACRIFLITFVLFMFFVQNTIRMNIKTEKIIVSTTDLIHSEKSLRETKWIPCFPENGRELEIFSKAPAGSLAHYVYYGLNRENETCSLMVDQKVADFNHVLFNSNSRRFLIGPDEGIKRFADHSRMLYMRNIFHNTNSVLDVLRTYYINKRLPKRVKRFLDQCLAAQFTYGHGEKLVRDFPNLFPTKISHEFKVYSSLKQYINDFTVVEDVSLERIAFVFRLYFAFLAAVLGICLSVQSTAFYFHLLRRFFFKRPKVKNFQRFR